MSQNIASLVTTSDALDTAAKFFRVMSKTGVGLEHLMLPVNNMTARKNLAAYLQAGCPKVSAPPLESRTFPVWKTIRIGGKSQKQMLNEMKSNDFFVSDWAQDIMLKDAFTTLSEQTSVHLARVKVSDLGFTEQPTTTELWARIRELGHELCPAEVGPHLRLQFADQERGDYFWVAMEQITDSGGDPDVFYVERRHVGKRWLDAVWVSPGHRWTLDYGLVFVLRK